MRRCRRPFAVSVAVCTSRSWLIWIVDDGHYTKSPSVPEHPNFIKNRKINPPSRPWGKRREFGRRWNAVPTAAPRGRAAVPSAAATPGGSRSVATLWKAAILAVLQPPADHHRISQCPPGRDGVPPPSAPHPPVVARGACCPLNDVHSLQTMKTI